MIKMNDLSLLDIAAKSTLTDDVTKWIYEAIDFALKRRYQKIMKKFWLDIDNLAEIEIDYLLWEYHVDYIGENTNAEEKRKLVKKAIVSHFNKGTVGSIKTICKILFGNAEIKEWFEYNGRPGYFKINTLGDLKDEKDFLKVIDVVNEYKNVRSWLESLKFLRTEEGNLYFGDYKKYKIKYNLGSTNVSIPNSRLGNYFGIMHRSRYLIR